MSQAEFKKRLKVQMLRPENQVCSDCPERQPRWASLIKAPPGAPPGSESMGAFCCLECSGSHRRLGVHIAFVRSINLDQWKEKEVLAMENGGNGKVNQIFEARLSVSKPTNAASGTVRERFIRDKYERRKFYDPSAFERVSQMEARREREEVVSGVQKRMSGSRKPSDAARRRVEERAAKSKSGGSASRSARSVKAPAPKPAPAPAPVADLLDFGDFSSFEATSGVQASVASASNPAPPAAPPAAPPQEPELDMFANMSVGNNPGEVSNGHPGQQQAAEQKKMSNTDIMSMFHAPVAQQNPMQQNMYAVQNNGMGGQSQQMNPQQMGMMNSMNSQQQQQMNPQQMGMMNNGMSPQQQQPMNPQQVGMMNSMNSQQQQQMNPQQMGMMNNGMNPQQQQMMANQMQMMQMQKMMSQQGMGNMNNSMGGSMNGQQGMGGSMNNNMGMMGGQQGMGGSMGGGGMMQQQQQQQPQMNSSMMMMQGGGGGGGMMQPGQQQQQQGGGNANQFAEFGNFGR